MALLSVAELLQRGDLWSAKHSAQVKKAPFGPLEIDSVLNEGGLSFGAIHAFGFPLYPPLHLFAAIAANALSQKEPAIVWVGRSCWPTPHLLEQIAGQLAKHEICWNWQQHALFIDPPSAEKRLWAITHLLQSRTVTVTVADGRNLNFALTRRLQLAAKRGNSLGLLALPEREIHRSLACRTKWQVSPLPSADESPCWKLELLRARGLSAPLAWDIRWSTTTEHLLECQKELTMSELRAVR